MRHIYEKMGVHRRTEAVERARDLGLLGPPRSLAADRPTRFARSGRRVLIRGPLMLWA